METEKKLFFSAVIFSLFSLLLLLLLSLIYSERPVEVNWAITMIAVTVPPCLALLSKRFKVKKGEKRVADNDIFMLTTLMTVLGFFLGFYLRREIPVFRIIEDHLLFLFLCTVIYTSLVYKISTLEKLNLKKITGILFFQAFLVSLGVSYLLSSFN